MSGCCRFSVGFLLAACVCLTGCRKEPDLPLRVEAYVWQSADKPAVRDAMMKSEDFISRLHVRAAEMRWDGGQFVTQWFVKELPATNCGLVVRIGASASGLEWTPERIAEVAAVFKQVAELSPSEIQCDFDCPQRRLDGYADLLAGLRKAVGRIPLVPTALPSWLDERDFGKLARVGSGYVLQVHSLQLPKHPGEPIVIFDPAEARTAAKKAARIAVPFRIAMATYGCEVRFGEDGKVLDVVSEDLAEMPPGVMKRDFALADPVASAQLVREWKSERPEGLRGIIWYRLPVVGDRRNWPLETLRLVARGEISESLPVLEATPGPGARDLTVENHGKFPVKLPQEVLVRSTVTAADGAGAYRVEESGDGVKFLRRDDIWPWLDPGKKIASGWLRMVDDSVSIDLQVSP